MNKLILSCGMFLCFSVAFGSAHASDQIYQSIDEVPAFLLNDLRPNIYEEQYMARHLEFIRSHAHGTGYLDQEGSERWSFEKKRQQKSQQRLRILGFDRNLDGVVTQKEIEENALNDLRMPRELSDDYVKKQIRDIMSFDVNGDGKVSFEETIVLKPDQKIRQLELYDDYLSLDVDGDGKLSVQELKDIVTNIFLLADFNANGVIDADEYQDIKSSLSVRVGASCLPKRMARDVNIEYLGVYEGVTLSNISVAKNNVETNVIDIFLDKDIKPTALVLSSYAPVIWQVSGATENLKHVYVNSYEMADQLQSAGGVTGVSKNQVSFMRRNCLSPYPGDEKAQNLEKNVLTRLFGREPSRMVISYSPQKFKISAQEIESILASPKKIDRFAKDKTGEQILWDEFLRKKPGGLAEIKLEDVVSAGEAKVYEVLPGLAGMAKLVQSGHIEPIISEITTLDVDAVNDGPIPMHKVQAVTSVRVIKDIPHYPSNLPAMTKIIIADGVAAPSGDAGFACAFREGSNELLTPSVICGGIRRTGEVHRKK